MAVPKRRISTTRRDKGRSHHALRKPHYVRCPQCDAAVLPHHVCDRCGYYQRRTAIEVKEE